MRLVINIPCYNEEDTLPLVLQELPAQLPGISDISVQIVDDGSTDDTVRVGKSFGCRVIEHDRNLGLGYAFQTGVNAAIASGCDIFVNTDADNQYPSRSIVDLVQPVLENKADMVIGDRQPWKVRHFSLSKRFLQWVGNRLVGLLLNIHSPDAVSGFRAYSRLALEKLHVTASYSYTLDTLAQAAYHDLRITSVMIQPNPPTRESRLATNIFQYIALTMLNFIQVLLIYEPGKIFLWGIFPVLLCVLFALLTGLLS
ncbi:MAG: glycosyltransferase family 2 protein [Chloroflexi bacterium]|nr:glycosyltransferase family 2 protein [Chloroflexota bacterium]